MGSGDCFNDVPAVQDYRPGSSKADLEDSQRRQRTRSALSSGSGPHSTSASQPAPSDGSFRGRSTSRHPACDPGLGVACVPLLPGSGTGICYLPFDDSLSILSCISSACCLLAGDEHLTARKDLKLGRHFSFRALSTQANGGKVAQPGWVSEMLLQGTRIQTTPSISIARSAAASTTMQ